MNWIDQDVPTETADELAARREDPLVTAAQARAPEAFSQLYAIYSFRLYRTITAITKNPEDTQDALEETFLRAHLRVHAFEGRSGIYSWLSRIAMNAAFMVLRKSRARPEVLFDPQPDNRFKTTYLSLRTLLPILRRPTTCVSVQRRPCARSVASIPRCLYRARQRLSATPADQKCFATHHPRSLAEFAGRDSALPAMGKSMSRKSDSQPDCCNGKAAQI
jgi:RNA polymerase sigma factor (sigma-70 family)